MKFKQFRENSHVDGQTGDTEADASDGGKDIGGDAGTDVDGDGGQGTDLADDAGLDTETQLDTDAICADRKVELHPLGSAELILDLRKADDTLEIGCTTGSNSADMIVAVWVKEKGRLSIKSSTDGACLPPDHGLALFHPTGKVDDCAKLGEELACLSVCDINMGTAPPLPELDPGIYYLVVADDLATESAVLWLWLNLDCPAGTIPEGENCVAATCSDIASSCLEKHRECTETNDGAICGKCLEGFKEVLGRCVPSDASFGGSCRVPKDCPGTSAPGAKVVCEPYTGGHCAGIDVSECEQVGEPCTGDAESICVSDRAGRALCLGGCNDDSDCRPGYFCDGNAQGSGLKACQPIRDCGSRGCNGTKDSHYCDDGRGLGLCWVDACVDHETCALVKNGDGSCTNFEDQAVCGCLSGYAWQTSSAACVDWSCGAENLGLFSGGRISHQGDTCAGDSFYGNTRVGCLGVAAPGPELVYELGVPAGETVDIEATPKGGALIDPVVYLIARCDDHLGETCRQGWGSDGQLGSGAEQLTFVNEGISTETIYIVVDTKKSMLGDGCGTLEVTFSGKGLSKQR